MVGIVSSIVSKVSMGLQLRLQRRLPGYNRVGVGGHRWSSGLRVRVRVRIIMAPLQLRLQRHSSLVGGGDLRIEIALAQLERCVPNWDQGQG